MKTILYTILTLAISISSFSQNSNLTPFVGNWEWQNENETFKVNIFIDGEYLKGHYELVETNSGITTTIYKSNKLLNSNIDFYYGYAIFGKSNDGIKFGASIEDNVLYGDNIHTTKTGSLGFIIQNPSCNGCPITATWKVSILQGLKSSSTPENFTIPTDIILTKQ